MTHARFTTGAALAATLLLAALPARAQQPAAAPPPPVSMLGQVAPDFTLPSVTRESGAVRPFHLADFRGQTVVLFFFPKARTKG